MSVLNFAATCNMTSAYHTHTENDSESRFLSTAEAIGVGVTIYTLNLFLIGGNLLVILAFLSESQLKITRNYYIFNLALSDLLLGVFIIPVYSHTIWAGDWKLGKVSCLLWLIADGSVVTNSHICILLITYDRYILVQDALRYTSHEMPDRAKVRMIITWVVCVTVYIILVMLGEWFNLRNNNYCPCSPYSPLELPYIIGIEAYDIPSSIVWMTLEVALPLFMITALNIKVYKTIKKRVRKDSAVSNLVYTTMPSFHILANFNLALSSHTGYMHSNSNSKVKTQTTVPTVVKTNSIVSQPPALETIFEEHGSLNDIQQNKRRVSIVTWASKVVIHSDDGSRQEVDNVFESEAEAELGFYDADDDSLEMQSYHRSDSVSSLQIEHLESLQMSIRHPQMSIRHPQMSIRHPQMSIRHPHSTSQSGDNDLVQPTTSSTNQHDHSTINATPEYHRSSTLPVVSPISLISPLHTHPPPACLAFKSNISTLSESEPHACSTSKITIRKARNSVSMMSKYKFKQDRKAALTISLLIALFVIFKVPYAIGLILEAICQDRCISVKVYETLQWLYWAKSLTNPFVYAFISKRFRNYCVKLWNKVKCKNKVFPK